LQSAIQEEQEVDDEKIVSRKERYEQRNTLIKNTESVPELKEARERLDFNNDSIIRAEAAQYVYRVDEFNRGTIAKLPEAPEGLILVDTSQIEGLDEAVFLIKKQVLVLHYFILISMMKQCLLTVEQIMLLLVSRIGSQMLNKGLVQKRINIIRLCS